jgi:hypothetical protein
VRDDEPTSSHHDSPATSNTSARSFRRIVPVSLVVLVSLTSLAVASIDPWLVGPYLLAIAVVLFAPSRQPSNSVASPHFSFASAWKRLRGHAVWERPRADESSALNSASGSQNDTARTVQNDAAMTGAVKPAKGRRPRGRPRVKVLKTVEAEPCATWVRVGPGKFVRLEGPMEASEVGLASSEPGPGDGGHAPHLTDLSTRARGWPHQDVETAIPEQRIDSNHAIEPAESISEPVVEQPSSVTDAADTSDGTVLDASDSEAIAGEAAPRDRCWDLEDDCNGWQRAAEPARGNARPDECGTEDRVTSEDRHLPDDSGSHGDRFRDKTTREDMRLWSRRKALKPRRPAGHGAWMKSGASRLGRPVRGGRYRFARPWGRPHDVSHAYLSRGPPGPCRHGGEASTYY